MLSKEEIEKAKEDFKFFNEGDYITKEMSDSKNVLLEYIDQLESYKQKLIEKLEKDIELARKEYQINLSDRQDGIREEGQEILSILKGENHE